MENYINFVIIGQAAAIIIGLLKYIFAEKAKDLVTCAQCLKAQIVCQEKMHQYLATFVSEKIDIFKTHFDLQIENKVMQGQRDILQEIKKQAEV